MDLVIGLWWSAAFTVIIIVLGALNYFLGQSHSDIQINEKKSPIDSSNQQQQQSTRTTTTNNRRKTRNANKKQRQLAALAASANSDQNDDNQSELEPIISTVKIDEEDSVIESSSIQPIDDDQFEDPLTIEEEILTSPSHVEEEQTVPQPIKQCNQNVTESTDLIESILPSKPKASVAPVKQSYPSTTDQSKDLRRNNHHSKSNGNASIGHFHSHQEYNPLPPRFQQQRQQKFLARKSKNPSSGRPNDSFKRQQYYQEQQHFNNHHPIDSLSQNGYSSESDALTGKISSSSHQFIIHSHLESSSTAPPPSIESQHSSKRSDILPTSSNHTLDECMSLFDNTSLNADQLELILNKILTKHMRNKQDRQQQQSSPNRPDNTLQSLLDETYHNQAKILALELQSEKNRVHELSKINADLDTTIRQLQQPNPNIPSYQQTILQYQMHTKRLTDENARLVHQLHTYSIMPASINELKQQYYILSEQLRQITMRNSHLEQEIIDAEQAKKQAAEIYYKGE